MGLTREQVASLARLRIPQVCEYTGNPDAHLESLPALPRRLGEPLGIPERCAPDDAQDHQSQREAEIDLEPQARAHSAGGTV